MRSSSHSCRALRSISLKSVSVRGSVVNLLYYLPDQLLRGCQSADNQVQALKNQVTEGFLVHGSRLPELDAKLVQIQPFHGFLSVTWFQWISRIWYLEDLCSSLLGHLQTLLYFPIVLDFRMFLSVDFIYFVYPCLVETSRGSIFITMVFLILCFTLCPFETKRGSIFYLDWECISNRSSDFCPRMAKGGVC
jgi:hypothetical protein